ncbi:MAG: hypothetical protein IKS98_07645 [Lachnospiraceae bacterium]|nr:hypothetical protein [Lachnospiraceae bacterium]
MRKLLIIFVNVVIISAILIFVVMYSRYTSRDSYQRQIENFEDTTVTMEKVTENYLEGEQRIDDADYKGSDPFSTLKCGDGNCFQLCVK